MKIKIPAGDMAKGKNKTNDSSPPKCRVCDGKGKVPNPEGGKKVTCPYCRGSGLEPNNDIEDIIEENED